MKTFVLLFSLFFLFTAGCERRDATLATPSPLPMHMSSPTPQAEKGVFEKAGEKIDRGLEKTGDSLEKAGQEIEQGFERAGEKLQGE